MSKFNLRTLNKIKSNKLTQNLSHSTMSHEISTSSIATQIFFFMISKKKNNKFYIFGIEFKLPKKQNIYLKLKQQKNQAKNSTQKQQ